MITTKWLVIQVFMDGYWEDYSHDNLEFIEESRLNEYVFQATKYIRRDWRAILEVTTETIIARKGA